MKKVMFIISVLFIAVALFACKATNRQYANVTVSVTNQSGTPLVGETVYVYNAEQWAAKQNGSTVVTNISQITNEAGKVQFGLWDDQFFQTESNPTVYIAVEKIIDGVTSITSESLKIFKAKKYSITLVINQ